MSKALLNYSDEQIEEYKKELDIVASLSNLFSDNSAPMIYYRATENIYCRAFRALNVSRSDCTADAIFDFKTGVGIKTFLDKKGGSYQKIAEFNKQAPLYRALTGEDLIRKIAQLRNDRIDFTVRNYGLKAMIYHCILRNDDGSISVYEEPMHRINIENIKIQSLESNKCTFTDGIEEYEFYFSKSTLFKYFNLHEPFLVFKVNILPDPMDALVKLAQTMTPGSGVGYAIPKETFPSLIIPLYSENKTRGRFVAERSGLNQWNANGRPRNQDEVYIPFPKHIRQTNEDFFPARYVSWDLKLPNNEIISMAVCQSDGKALMSNPNKALGKWLLRSVLKLNYGYVVTYDDLLALGIDSLIFRKHSDGTYDCDFIDNSLLEE